jgi:adhesin/invasin
VTYSGLAPGFAGLYQVNVVVPAGLAAGNQNLQITINGISSNVATVAIAQ